jgi:NAD+ synthase (glutamine-hydrolysing)
MRVALCQINTTVGDFDGNRARMLEAAGSCERAGAVLAVFPELTLTGYQPRDLLDRPAFVEDNLRALDRLVAELPRALTSLVGFVDRRQEGSRRTLHNAVALIRAGAVQQVFCKRLLPTYDVFDEDRYFEPGASADVFELLGVRFGVTICEDIWNAVESPLRRHYPQDPVAELVSAGAQVLINVSGSPFNLSKHGARPQMLAAVAKQHQVPLVFVNLVGGNDDLIYDGSSAVYGPDGACWASAPSFREHLLVCELAPSQPRVEPVSSDASAALEALVLGTRDYAHKCGFERAVLGLSGGIDSSLVAAIAVRALGPRNVLGVAMPTRYSSEGSLHDARALAEALGIGFRAISIDAIFQRYLDVLGPELDALGEPPVIDTTFENVQARIRGNTLMAISNRFGHLLLTTGNKSEIAVGYCTLYGDMAGGLAVISDLPKTFVYEVAREHNRQAGATEIPESCFTKPPSAELRPDQKDEDSLPPYAILDPLLERLIEDGESSAQLIAQGFERALVERVAGMVQRNEYKRRQMPPGLIVTRKAFGPGRRYPIAQRYRG